MPLIDISIPKSIANALRLSKSTPGDQQRRVLKKLLKKAAPTQFGRNYQFNSIGVGTAASTTAGEIRATGDITAFYSSDVRLKENIQPIQIELIKELLTDIHQQLYKDQ